MFCEAPSPGDLKENALDCVQGGALGDRAGCRAEYISTKLIELTTDERTFTGSIIYIRETKQLIALIHRWYEKHAIAVRAPASHQRRKKTDCTCIHLPPFCPPLQEPEESCVCRERRLHAPPSRQSHRHPHLWRPPPIPPKNESKKRCTRGVGRPAVFVVSLAGRNAQLVYTKLHANRRRTAALPQQGKK